MIQRILLAGLIAGSCSAYGQSGQSSLEELLRERLASVVAVEFLIESEIARQPAAVFGVVADREGHIALPDPSIDGRIPPERLRDFKVFLAEQADTPYTAEYVGPDPLSGWHFIRVEEKARSQLKPVSEYTVDRPHLGEELWGVSLRTKEENFTPYFLHARLAFTQRLAFETGFCSGDVSGPGLPVFDLDGNLVGIAGSPLPDGVVLFPRGDSNRPLPMMILDAMESNVFMLANEAVPLLQRLPQNVHGRPIPWIGIYGLEPIAPEVARFLKLEGQAALVISEVLEESPAEAAGLQNRDIIVGIDGEPLPPLKPDRAAIAFLEQQILQRRPGDVLSLTLLRGRERVQAAVTVSDEPKMIREAESRYFDELGFSIREFLFDDRVRNRLSPQEESGVVAGFVKPNSPASAAGLRGEDWIREIDGRKVQTFSEAVELLAGLDASSRRSEVVLMTSRNGETSVVRLKLQ